MQTVESAKQFLLDHVLEQATRDGVTLSETEKRMFLFSEASPSPDWEANEKFEAEYDDSQYERKIAKLLRRAYARDKKAGTLEAWKGCLKTLKKEDFYGLVIIDQAGIARPKDYSAMLDCTTVLTIVSFAIGGFAIVVFLNPLHWGYLRSDVIRLVGAVLLLGIAWGIGELEK